MRSYISKQFCFLLLVISSVSVNAQAGQKVNVYDFFELTIRQKTSTEVNPFTDVTVQMRVTKPDGSLANVEGFCDAQDGSVFKIRYMPVVSGKHSYVARFTSNKTSKTYKGSFEAVNSNANGVVRVDQQHPWHMIYEGSGKHYFWNSTTAYWLMGWKDEQIIRSAIDRFASYDINRIRVAINGRQDDGKRWFEPLVKESKDFSFLLNPWIAQKPQDLDHPGFDVTRFNVAHWQKLDRLASHAKKKGIVVSFIFYVDGLEHGVDPFKKANMGNDDEKRYYAYAAARYSAFDNIMWDITNEYHLFRTVDWVNKMGPFLKSKDINNHILSIHGSSDFPFRTAPFVDVVLYQSWDECGGYNFITNARKKQEASGRIIPQINEEYGYEDHYPTWGCGATATKEPHFRDAVHRSQLAWEMYMAGGYQTTGERANEGTGTGNDTGGGWINGRGNEKMILLKYHKIIKDAFEQTQYWKMQPHNELVSYGDMCLADPGNEYIAYFRTNHARIALPQGANFSVTIIDPLTGEQTKVEDYKVTDGAWHYTKDLNKHLVVLIKRK